MSSAKCPKCRLLTGPGCGLRCACQPAKISPDLDNAAIASEHARKALDAVYALPLAASWDARAHLMAALEELRRFIQAQGGV